MCPIVGPNPEVYLKLILLLSLLSFPALAQTQTYFEEAQAATRAVPTANPTTFPVGATRPLLLTSTTKSIRITVCPKPGDALLGTGTIRLYLWVQYVGGTAGRWTANPALDRTVTMTTTNVCQTFGLKVDVSAGYLLPATQGVTTSSGDPATVRVDPGVNS